MQVRARDERRGDVVEDLLDGHGRRTEPVLVRPDLNEGQNRVGRSSRSGSGFSTPRWLATHSCSAWASANSARSAGSTCSAIGSL